MGILFNKRTMRFKWLSSFSTFTVLLVVIGDNVELRTHVRSGLCRRADWWSDSLVVDGKCCSLNVENVSTVLFSTLMLRKCRSFSAMECLRRGSGMDGIECEVERRGNALLVLERENDERGNWEVSGKVSKVWQTIWWWCYYVCRKIFIIWDSSAGEHVL